jgi:hypothetical protein
MNSFIVKVQERHPGKIKLTLAEAVAMEEAGFRFSIFDEETDRFELSIPYQLAENRTLGTLTITQ